MPVKKLAEGDAVRISGRDAAPADAKTQLFFPHYRNMTGTLSKLFADNTAVILVDPESLPADVRARHETDTAKTRQKWLDGLSDEARNRLSAAEKKFSLRYTVLVSTDDLTPGEKKTDAAAVPPRKSLAEIEADEVRHLDEKTKKQ